MKNKDYLSPTNEGFIRRWRRNKAAEDLASVLSLALEPGLELENKKSKAVKTGRATLGLSL